MDEQELIITADLANIALQPEEMARLRSEVAAMVEFFAIMAELDLSKLSQALPPAAGWRVDCVQNSDLADAILEQSPDLEDRFVCIPNVL